jgi:ABC-type sugar transport system permease subunit/ABC-type glycerol-3-phosphate transport system substrate-binding protein
MSRSGVARALAVLLPLSIAAACARASDGRTVITYAGSAVGAEGEVLARQIARFEAQHPELAVTVVPSPDASDERHQRYVQWLNAGVPSPDVLQLDVVWTPELAAAGWIQPLDRYHVDERSFLDAAVRANRWQGALYAVPLFVDVGMLYVRTDLVPQPPGTFDELDAMARDAMTAHGVRYGFAIEGARYEGLVTVFLEVSAGFGGAILDPHGGVVVDSPADVRALSWLRDAVRHGVIPTAALGWQEEQARLAFQEGDAVFLRSWPYAAPLFADEAAGSRVAGKFAIAPMPATDDGRSAAALGGAQLAINARSQHADAAWQLVEFLTAPEAQVERARIAGEYPSRPALYRDGSLDGALSVPPADALAVIERATARPVTPVYAELSSALQIQLHRALTGQARAEAALTQAAGELRAIVGATEQPIGGDRSSSSVGALALLAVIVAIVIVLARRRRGRASSPAPLPREERLGWTFVAPALGVILLIALFPLGWTFWESLHAHDLRMPWQGRPFVGLAQYVSIGESGRFWAALAHTALFAIVTVSLELVLGTALALAIDGLRRGRGTARAVTLLPWAIPTVVAALIWQLLFADAGLVNAAITRAGAPHGLPWLVDATLAWVPIIVADVWKTTPFVALLLTAGLSQIDRTLYDAARTDGANRAQTFVHVTLPLLKPAILVVLIFRTLDAIRVFDLVYVLTGGGPGTATEPISLYAFTTLFADLRFGRGAALSMIVFLLAFGLALGYVRLLGTGEEERA